MDLCIRLRLLEVRHTCYLILLDISSTDMEAETGSGRSGPSSVEAKAERHFTSSVSAQILNR